MNHLRGTKTEKNLLAAFAGESQARNRYTFLSGRAKKDGLVQIASIFEDICEGKVFKRHSEVTWRCRNCGYLHHGKEAPGICPACAHPRDHYELLAENW